jgi:hypothetical protein
MITMKVPATLTSVSFESFPRGPRPQRPQSKLTVDFRRVRKTSKSDYELRHVCLSVRTEQLGSDWTDFRDI